MREQEMQVGWLLTASDQYQQQQQQQMNTKSKKTMWELEAKRSSISFFVVSVTYAVVYCRVRKQRRCSSRSTEEEGGGKKKVTLTIELHSLDFVRAATRR